MGLWDRLKSRRKKKATQTSTATASLSTSVSASSPETSTSSYDAEAAAKRAAELEAARLAEQKRIEEERKAAEEAARLEAERLAAAEARKQAALNIEAAKAEVTGTSTTTKEPELNPDGTVKEETTDPNLEPLSLNIAPLAAPTTSGDSITSLAESGLATLGTNLDSALTLQPTKTEEELQADRDAAAKARLDAATEPVKTTEPTTLSLSSLSEPTLSTLSEPTLDTAQLIAPTSDPLAAALPEEPVVKEGLAEGTSRLLPSVFEGDAAYVKPTSEIYSTPVPVTTSPETVILESLAAPTAEPTTLEAPTLMTLSAPLTETTALTSPETTAITQENLLTDTPQTEAVVEEVLSAPVSYEPSSGVTGEDSYFTGGGINTDPYAAKTLTTIEEGIGTSGGTVESYNTLFDKYYADYFVDEKLTKEEADAFLSAAPTAELSSFSVSGKDPNRSYEPSSKVQNLLENTGVMLNSKGGMTYVPEEGGFIIPESVLAKIAEQRGLRQAKGLPVKDEGKFWELDENGNVVAKVFAKAPGYKGSTGINAGKAGGAGKHGFLKGTKAQKRAIGRNYRKKGAKLLNTSKGKGYSVDLYDDVDDTFDVYGYEFSKGKDKVVATPKFFESTNLKKAEQVYDTWVKAFNVKYGSVGTPAERATAKREAKAQAGKVAAQATAQAKATANRKAAQAKAAEAKANAIKKANGQAKANAAAKKTTPAPQANIPQVAQKNPFATQKTAVVAPKPSPKPAVMAPKPVVTQSYSPSPVATRQNNFGLAAAIGAPKVNQNQQQRAGAFAPTPTLSSMGVQKQKPAQAMGMGNKKSGGNSKWYI